MPEKPIPTREAYSRALLDLMGENPNIVALDADVAKSVGTNKVHKAYPWRTFNMGIAEQNMMGTAAGLATTGKIVFASTYAVFAALRACEQIRTFIAYPHLNVKIGASHGGLHTGMDGVTHQGVEDIGVMRSIPGITILSPSDPVSAYKLTMQAALYDGPVYIRLTRNPVPDIHTDDEQIEIGKAIPIGEQAGDVGIIATGIMVLEAMKAKENLLKRGTRAAILEVHTIRPLDREAVIALARNTGRIVVAEDHNINGGLGSAVAEALSESLPTKIVRIGLRDVFGESGDPNVLLHEYGMDSEAIEEASRMICTG